MGCCSCIWKPLFAASNALASLFVFLSIPCKENRENQPYNLLVMELLHHLFRHQDPTAVARSSTTSNSRTAANSAANASAASTGTAPTTATGGSRGGTLYTSTAGRSLLKQQLTREKQAVQQLSSSRSSRHSHFSGTLLLERQGGKKQLISAANVGETRTAIGGGSRAAYAPNKRKSKKAEPFIGRSSSHRNQSGEEQFSGGPAQVRAWRTLDTFCERFISDCCKCRTSDRARLLCVFRGFQSQLPYVSFSQTGPL